MTIQLASYFHKQIVNGSNSSNSPVLPTSLSSHQRRNGNQEVENGMLLVRVYLIVHA